MPGWNFADVWEVIAEQIPDAPCQVQGDRRVSWAEFDRRANGVARVLLDAGAQEQDKVAQYLQNCPEYLESIFASFKAGLAPINTNFRYADDELVYLWDNADCVAVVFHGSFTGTIERIRERVPRVTTWLWVDDGSGPRPDWAVAYEEAAAAHAQRAAGPWGRDGEHLIMLYTGGTTGMPKGVMWRQDDLFRNLVSQVNPVYKDAGADPAIVGDAFGKPMLKALNENPGRWDLASLFLVASSGVMFSESVKQGLLEHHPNMLLVDAFSSSEAVGMGQSISSGTSATHTAKFTLGENTIVITDDGRRVEPGSGEIGRVAVGGHQPVGYYKDPEKTAATFIEFEGRRYACPGDYARVEADGSLTLLGRGSVVINTAGEKVFPEEVEEALKTYPGVRDAVAGGIPHDRYGQAGPPGGEAPDRAHN